MKIRLEHSLSLILVIFYSPLSDGHGRLMDPPARNSMWRFGFVSPVNYNDNEVFCGGVARQFEINGGACGVCGDPADEPHPQQHETGGRYGSGQITKTYVRGSWIDIEVELTANHKGRFQLKVCPLSRRQQEATQACLDRYELVAQDGSNEFYIETNKHSTSTYLKAKLPYGLTCNRCVLQWTWRSANSWGNCGNGTGALGCGPQETFRNCADIRIVPSRSQLPYTDNPRAILVPSKDGRGTEQLVVRSQICVATEAYRAYNRMSDWCQLNCLAYPPNCPPAICECLTSCRAEPGYQVTDFECNKYCLRYPHNDQCPRGCKCSSGEEDTTSTAQRPPPQLAELDVVIIENDLLSDFRTVKERTETEEDTKSDYYGAANPLVVAKSSNIPITNLNSITYSKPYNPFQYEYPISKPNSVNQSPSNFI